MSHTQTFFSQISPRLSNIYWKMAAAATKIIQRHRRREQRLRFRIFQKCLWHSVNFINANLYSLTYFHAVLNRILIVQTWFPLLYFLKAFVQYLKLVEKPVQSFVRVFPFLLVAECVIVLICFNIIATIVWALKALKGFCIRIIRNNLIISNSFRFPLFFRYYPF